MYSTDDLLPMAKACGADMIVMSDYPNEPGAKTVDAAKQTAGIYHENGFKTFFVPQSIIGDLDDYLETMQWALDNPGIVDRIGLSILGCPNAYGVERDNKLQRYMSRYAILREMDSRGMLIDYKHENIFHCLGMVDGPNEIQLLQQWHNYIATWDSSAAVWAGLNGVRFDNSPTGLVNGKFEEEVDFAHSADLPVDILNTTMYNIDYIDRLANNEDSW